VALASTDCKMNEKLACLIFKFNTIKAGLTEVSKCLDNVLEQDHALNIQCFFDCYLEFKAFGRKM